jgi:hypothetical protein
MSEVETMQAKSKEDVLIEDGEASLYLVRDIGFDGGFGIGVQNGGGFSCVFATPDCWEKAKAKVDAFVKTKFGAGNVDTPINTEP